MLGGDSMWWRTVDVDTDLYDYISVLEDAGYFVFKDEDELVEYVLGNPEILERILKNLDEGVVAWL